MTASVVDPSVEQAAAAPPSVLARVLPYVLAIVGALLVTGVVIVALGYDPFAAYEAILTTSFRTPFGFVETLHRWVPLTLQALAFAIPLTAGRFNIGGEGQLLVGAIAAAGVGIELAGAPAAVLLPAVILAAVAAGALWAAIAGVLLGQFGVNEILSTVLLNFVAFSLVDYVASEVWSDPAAGFPSTTPIGAGARLPGFGSPPLHTGVLLAAVVVTLVIVALRRSVPGFELRAVGANERAALVHGVRVRRLAVGSLVVGGAVAGLSGAIEVAGLQYKLVEGIQSNYLLLGIIIALIARGNVLLVPFVAFGIAVLEIGASAMQRTADVPAEMLLIIEALILLFVLLSDVVAARLRRRT